MADNEKTTRRDFLFTATYTIGAVGLGATIWTFIVQMNISIRAPLIRIQNMRHKKNKNAIKNQVNTCKNHETKTTTF